MGMLSPPPLPIISCARLFYLSPSDLKFFVETSNELAKDDIATFLNEDLLPRGA